MNPNPNPIVDITGEDARKLLAAAPVRASGKDPVEVLINDEWLTLCRRGADDTFYEEWRSVTAERTREAYLARKIIGAVVRAGDSAGARGKFIVVDGL